MTTDSYNSRENNKQDKVSLQQLLRGDALICSSLADNLAEEAMIRSHNDWILSQRGESKSETRDKDCPVVNPTQDQLLNSFRRAIDQLLKKYVDVGLRFEPDDGEVGGSGGCTCGGYLRRLSGTFADKKSLDVWDYTVRITHEHSYVDSDLEFWIDG